MADEPILVINSGSSSLKFGLYVQRDGEEQAVLDGLADGIGGDSGKLELKDAQSRTLRSESVRFASEDEALSHAARWLAEVSELKPVAVGHRVVHGGPHLVSSPADHAGGAGGATELRPFRAGSHSYSSTTYHSSRKSLSTASAIRMFRYGFSHDDS